MPREHWTTDELCEKLGPPGKPLSRSRVTKLAKDRGIVPIGYAAGRGRAALWPPDAHKTLKPGPTGIGRWVKARPE